jgi:hypothetical protein
MYWYDWQRSLELKSVPLIYGHPVAIGPTVVEDDADELVDVKSVEVDIELVEGETGLGVYDQELDDRDG